jgi:hypothetical protein
VTLASEMQMLMESSADGCIRRPTLRNAALPQTLELTREIVKNTVEVRV